MSGADQGHPAMDAPEGCPRCGHLRGDRLDRCPECGIGAAEGRGLRRRGTARRRWTRGSIAVLVATYAPQAWVLVMPGQWVGHRMDWISMYPILPGLLPTAIGQRVLGHDEWTRMVVAGIFTGLLLLVASWCASRGPRWLAVTCTILLAANVPLAFALHAAYSA